MATATDTREVVRVRTRTDLRAVDHFNGWRSTWVVKDPVALRYFRLGAEEHSILDLLDGTRTFEEIQRVFERRFPPLRLSRAQFGGFLAHLHRLGLVVVDAPAQGTVLERRRRERAWWTAAGVLHLLAIRFRGVDPEPVLRPLERATRWLFRPWTAAACLVLVASALTLVVARAGEISARLPSLDVLAAPGHLVLLAATLAGIKVLHELGHALSCRHYGRECHEIGVMLLAFVPCLYCNVSDAWMLRDRWRRIAVSAAGMGVEVVLASACTLLWWWSEPGVFQTLCLYVMVLCSVNTLLLNGNPLLRYDGYYILSDLWGVPNLAERAQRAVRHVVLHRWLGIEAAEGAREVPIASLFLYGALSAVYRVFVVLGVLWFLDRLLKPHGLQAVAVVLGLMVISGMLLTPVVRGVRWVRTPAMGPRVHRGRLALAVFVAGVAAGGAALVPIPRSITAEAVIEPRGAVSVYVPVAGVLTECVQSGARVAAGDQLARLGNLELEHEAARLAGEHRQQQIHVDSLESRRGTDRQAAAQLPTARAALAALEQQHALVRQDVQRLTLVAPVAGTVLPPPVRKGQDASPVDLPEWTGTPLDDVNQGAKLFTGTLLCRIGDPDAIEAALAINESDAERVRVGGRVRLQLDAQPLRRLEGTLVEVAAAEAPDRQRAESTTGRAGARGRMADEPATAYTARVELDPQGARLCLGARGRARVSTDAEPLALRVYRFLRHTFGFRL
jgi:putative peptide zinc metalloprotease protein